MPRTLALAVGAECGGVEEAAQTSGTCVASTFPTAIINNDTYALRLGTTTSRLDYYPAKVDTSAGYYVAFEMNYDSLGPLDGICFIAGYGQGQGEISVYMTLSGGHLTLSLRNQPGSTLDSKLMGSAAGIKITIELYWEQSATGAWEWWIDGTSEGSGTADFDGGYGTGIGWIRLQNAGGLQYVNFNNLIHYQGVSSSDRLGTGAEVICCASDGGTPTTGGDALSSGAWTDVQDVPADTNAAAYIGAGAAKAGWVEADGTHTNVAVGPSGLGLSKIVGAKLVAIPNQNASAVVGEDLAPDTIAVQTNLTGAVTDIDEDPDSPDGNWLAASGSSVLRTTFPTPTVNPNSTQERFRAWVRRSASSTTQTLYPEGTPSVTNYTNQGGSSVLDAINETQDNFGTSYIYGTADNPSIDQLDFPTPNITPSGNQTVRVYCAKADAGTSTIDNGLGGTPTIQINIYDSGGLHHTGSVQNVTTSAWISEVFTATGLDAASMYVECITANNGGGPNEASVAIDSVEWQVVSAAAETVSYNLEVWESGVKVSGITGQTGNITSTSGQMLTFTWDSSQLGTASGANVELYLDQTAGSIDFIEIGAVEWSSYAALQGQVYLGNDVDGVTIMDTTVAGVSNDVGYDDWGAYEEWYSEDVDIVADTTESMRVGFGITAGYGGDTYDELLGMVISAPNATWSIFPSFSYHVRRIKRDNMKTLINL